MIAKASLAQLRLRDFLATRALMGHVLFHN